MKMESSSTSQPTFHETLERLIDDTASRSNRSRSDICPFICNGKPINCNVFIVGTNPSSTVSWSQFWDYDSEAFDKNSWAKVDEQERAAKKLAQGKSRFRPQSVTRSRIEILINALG